MEIYEKIRILRQDMGMPRAEFARQADISANTLLAIESKGNSPRSDILEKIARTWPKYARWLLVGDDPIGLRFGDEVLHWIDICNPIDINGCIVKPTRFGKIQIVMSNESRLFGAIIWIDKPIYNETEFLSVMECNKITPAVFVKPLMGWDTGIAEENAEIFREWLCAIDPKVLRDAEIVSVEQYYLERSLREMRLNTDLIHQTSHVTRDSDLIGKIYEWKSHP